MMKDLERKTEEEILVKARFDVLYEYLHRDGIVHYALAVLHWHMFETIGIFRRFKHKRRDHTLGAAHRHRVIATRLRPGSLPYSELGHSSSISFMYLSHVSMTPS